LKPSNFGKLLAGIMLLLPTLVFAQTAPSNPDLRRIQVGVFRNVANAERAFNALRDAGFSPVYESHMGAKRVVLPGIDVRHLPFVLPMLNSAGFHNVWVREELDTVYRIQVGAFRNAVYAEAAFNTLLSAGLNPVFENHAEYRRLVLAGISTRHISSVLAMVYNSGFKEVWLREEPGRLTISEKWIVEPGNRFESFEFNQDSNFIVVERQDGASPNVHFGEYVMPRPDLIDMIDFGVLRIESRDGEDISFSFVSINEPETSIVLSAVREAPMPRTPETDLFARTWRVVNSNREDVIGAIVLFSINGTYLVSRPDGVSFISHWRWYNEDHEEFEYSHDNWWNYGRVRIHTIELGLLILHEGPGFYELVPATDF